MSDAASARAEIRATPLASALSAPLPTAAVATPSVVTAPTTRRPAVDERPRHGQHAATGERPSGAGSRRRGSDSTWTEGFGAFSVRCLQVLIVIATGAVLVVVAVDLNVVVIPVLLSLILASAFNPLTLWLEAHGWRRSLAALSTLVLGLAVLAAVLIGITLAVIAQWASLVAAASGGVDRLERWLASTGLPIDQQQFEQARKAAVSFLTSGSFASEALAGLSTATSLLTGLVLMLFVLFFFLKDGAAIWSLLIRPLSGPHRERFDRIGRRAVRVLGGYARGTAFVALVDAVFIGAGLLILRVPLAIPLAVLMFGTAFIPVVGSILAGLIAALVALVTGGPVTALIVIAIVIVVNQLEGILLQPIVMGRTVSLHPLAVLLVLTVGTVLGGVVGALLAVPVASVAWVAMKSWRPDAADLSAIEPDPVETVPVDGDLIGQDGAQA
jgi:putative heme transporter